MDNDLAGRLERIESHLAHLEHLCDQLNRTVTEQSQLLRKLQVQEQKIAQALNAAELERIKETNPRPPHYQ